MQDCQSLSLIEMTNPGFSNNTIVLETTSSRSESYIIVFFYLIDKVLCHS